MRRSFLFNLINLVIGLALAAVGLLAGLPPVVEGVAVIFLAGGIIGTTVCLLAGGGWRPDPTKSTRGA